MSTQALQTLSFVCAVAGFACFLWPLVKRWRGLDTPEERAAGARLRSKTWWAGLGLTVVAMLLQRATVG